MASEEPAAPPLPPALSAELGARCRAGKREFLGIGLSCMPDADFVDAVRNAVRTRSRLTVSFINPDYVVRGHRTPGLVVLEFGTDWCPHCQAEVPRIVALAKAGKVAVPIVGVATGTDPSAPNYPPSAWLQREGWPYPVLVDTKTETAARAYGLPGYPFLVFVDAQGQVVGRLSGEVEPTDLTKLFDALAAGQPLPIPGAGASSAGK